MKVVLGRSGAGLNRNADGYTTWVGAPHAAAQAEGGGATPAPDVQGGAQDRAPQVFPRSGRVNGPSDHGYT